MHLLPASRLCITGYGDKIFGLASLKLIVTICVVIGLVSKKLCLLSRESGWKDREVYHYRSCIHLLLLHIAFITSQHFHPQPASPQSPDPGTTPSHSP